MTACEAMTVAAVDNSTNGTSAHPGTMWKNGLSSEFGSVRISAPWPK